MTSQGIALYCLYDKTGNLLYVGITNNPDARFGGHARKAWWPDVARREVTWFSNRLEAGRAEAELIRGKEPRYNIQGNPAAMHRRRAELKRAAKPVRAIVPPAGHEPRADYSRIACDSITAARTRFGLDHAAFTSVLSGLLGWNVTPEAVAAWENDVTPPGDVLLAAEWLSTIAG